MSQMFFEQYVDDSFGNKFGDRTGTGSASKALEPYVVAMVKIQGEEIVDPAIFEVYAQRLIDEKTYVETQTPPLCRDGVFFYELLYELTNQLYKFIMDQTV